MFRYMCLQIQLIMLTFTMLGSVKAQALIPVFDWRQIASEIYAGVYPALAWSPDSHYIAIGDTNKSNLLIFDVQGESREAQIDIAIQDQYLRIPVIEWSHDGRYIAVLANSMVVIIDVANSDVLQTYTNSGLGNLTSLKWIDSSRKIALLDNLGFIYIYDVLESRMVMSIRAVWLCPSKLVQTWGREKLMFTIRLTGMKSATGLLCHCSEVPQSLFGMARAI